MENEKTINRISTTSDLETIGKLPKIKPYNGRIPACGVFCGWSENDVLQRYVCNPQMRKRKRV